jgi:hypothetical protein
VKWLCSANPVASAIFAMRRRHDYVAEVVTKERTATHYITDNKEEVSFT